MSSNKNSFYIVYNSFVNELGLSGLQLSTYSLIYSFCTQGQGRYNGSVSYLAKRTGASQNGVRKALKCLIKKGLIEKHQNGTDHPSYRIVASTDLLHSVDEVTTQSGVSDELSGINKKEMNNTDIDHLDMSKSELFAISDPVERSRCVKEFAYLFSDKDINDVSSLYLSIVELIAEMVALPSAKYCGETISSDSLWKKFVINLCDDEYGLSIRDFVFAVTIRIEGLNTKNIFSLNTYIRAVIWRMLNENIFREL